MITSPTALELIDAVIGFIEQRAAPQLKDRDAFLARVAVNALAAVRREIELGPQAQATGKIVIADFALHHDQRVGLQQRLRAVEGFGEE